MQNTSKYIELQESKARRQKKDKKAAKDAELWHVEDNSSTLQISEAVHRPSHGIWAVPTGLSRLPKQDYLWSNEEMLLIWPRSDSAGMCAWKKDEKGLVT